MYGEAQNIGQPGFRHGAGKAGSLRQGGQQRAVQKVNLFFRQGFYLPAVEALGLSLRQSVFSRVSVSVAAHHAAEIRSPRAGI